MLSALLASCTSVHQRPALLGPRCSIHTVLEVTPRLGFHAEMGFYDRVRTGELMNRLSEVSLLACDCSDSLRHGRRLALVQLPSCAQVGPRVWPSSDAAKPRSTMLFRFRLLF